jgi:hypothetical protein
MHAQNPQQRLVRVRRVGMVHSHDAFVDPKKLPLKLQRLDISNTGKTLEKVNNAGTKQRKTKPCP